MKKSSDEPDTEKDERPPHVHVHSNPLLKSGVEKRFEAYMMEFGVAVHSVFIGLAVGVSNGTTLKALLTALSFHQFFEGIALGSRISDAGLESWIHEVALTSIFAIASPIGASIAVGIINVLNPAGETFLLIQGTFDGVCGGILLYIGFSLLQEDFQADLITHCSNSKYARTKKAAMFLCMWGGGGLMAFIGKYL